MSQYDQGLLRQAPETSRQERQAGYNVDILGDSSPQTQPRSSFHDQDPERGGGPDLPLGARAADTPHAAVVNGRTSPVPEKTDNNNGTTTYNPYQDFSSEPTKKKPFLRTGKGRVILGLLALLIVGAIVGGAVGGTVGKHKSSTPSMAGDQSQPVSSTPTSGGGDSSGGDSSNSNSNQQQQQQGTGARPSSSVSSALVVLPVASGASHPTSTTVT